MMKNKNIGDFFSTHPLYKPLLIVEHYESACGVESPFDFNGITFSYYCSHEEETRTFEICLPKSSDEYWGKQMSGRVSEELLIENRLDFFQHFAGRCSSCKSYHVDFLVHVWSTEEIERDLYKGARISVDSDIRPTLETTACNSVYLEKVGVSPETKPAVDKELTKYFGRETSGWYFRGRKALSENLGIGAFAYFRRIIEKELLAIVSDIAKLNASDSSKITELLAEYNKSGKVHLLYENIFPYLPKSLQSLGDNPIKTLYQQTSQGLHNLTEEECLAKAGNVDLILRFVIKKINEEKSEILDIRNAIKSLNS